MTEESTKPEPPEIVTVLGGGWCAMFVDRDALPGVVIGVNDAAIYARCSAAISMDRLWTEHRWADLMGIGRKAFIREAALKNINAYPPWLREFACDHKSTTFSDDPRTLNGTNSGFCALNLAYLLKPKRLYLVGFSMNRSPNGAPYWFKNYPWAPEGATKPGKYQEWAGQFEQAAAAFKLAGTEVFNVSETSSLQTFHKISPAEFQRHIE